MAYVKGDIISASHFNNFASNFNSIWGVGTGDSGYGQSNTISNVTTNQTITASQWSTLLTRMESAKNHQGSTLTNITAPVTGDLIKPLPNLSGNMLTLSTNRLNNNGNYTDNLFAEHLTDAWSDITSCHIEIQFLPQTDSDRFYFNCGGSIRFSFDRTGGSIKGKNTEWTNFASDCGTINVGAHGTTKIGGSGTPSIEATNIGFYDLPVFTANQLLSANNEAILFRQYIGSSMYSPYTTNYIEIRASRIKNTANTINNIFFRVLVIDASSGDSVDGTWTNSTTLHTPNLTYLNNINVPTYSATCSQT